MSTRFEDVLLPLLAARGLTKAELARRVGVATYSVQRWKEHWPDTRLLPRIAEVLGVPASSLARPAEVTGPTAAELVAMGQRIDLAREELGVTQTHLATQLGVSRDTVRAWENGSEDPRAHLAQIAGILGTSEQYLRHGHMGHEGDLSMLPTSVREYLLSAEGRRLPTPTRVAMAEFFRGSRRHAHGRRAPRVTCCRRLPLVHS